MRLFRRGGGRSSDTPDDPSSQDPQLTALRFDTQAPLPSSQPGESIVTLNDDSFLRAKPKGDENHIKHLQQIFKPPSNQPFSSYVARSVTNSPKISGMPKSKVAGGKKNLILAKFIMISPIECYYVAM